MKITKRQLRRIIRESASPDRVHSIDPLTGRDTEKQPGLTGMEIEPSVDAIEDILNGLSDDGLTNADLITLLEDIIGSIKDGFVGEPT
jgi:hypothetical protein